MASSACCVASSARLDVAQDPVRHPVESVARGDGEAREGLLVTPLRPSDQVGIHAASALVAPGGSGRSHGMGAINVGAAPSSRLAVAPSDGTDQIVPGRHRRWGTHIAEPDPRRDAAGSVCARPGFAIFPGGDDQGTRGRPQPVDDAVARQVSGRTGVPVAASVGIAVSVTGGPCASEARPPGRR